MNAVAFRHFYEYHFTLNRILWNQCVGQLSDEQFTQPAAYSHGSVRDQIIHLMEVDDTWFSELQGIAPLDPLAPNVSDRNAIRAKWDSIEQRMRAYLAVLRDTMLFTQPVAEPDEDKDLFVWQVLLHVVNHGTDHRAQLLRLLKDLGVETTSQDYIFFAYERPFTIVGEAMTKAELLAWLQKAQRQWEGLLDEIGPERMEQPGVNGDWSMKDVIGHLTGWNQYLVARIRAASRGEAAPTPLWPAELQGDDAINAWIYTAYHERSLDDVLPETRDSFQQLLAVVGDLPDDAVIERAYRVLQLNGQRFSASEFFDHFHDDHEPDVRAWLERIG